MVKLSKSGVIGGTLLGFLCLFNSEKSYAASVTCQFMSGTTYSTSGEWVNNDSDIIAIMTMFGQGGIKLPLKTSVLGNLNAKKYSSPVRLNTERFIFLVVTQAFQENR